MQHPVCRSAAGGVCYVLSAHTPQYVDSHDGNYILWGGGETGHRLEAISGMCGIFRTYFVNSNWRVFFSVIPKFVGGLRGR